MHFIWPDRTGAILDHGQRDHFTANLGEAFDPAHDPDAIIFIHDANIACIVPALERGFDHAGCGRAHIAEHHIGSANAQFAAFFNAFDRDQLIFHVGHQTTDRAGFVELHRVGRDHRGGLRCAIAFEDFNIEFLADKGPRFVLDSFGAANRQTNRIHRPIFGDPGVLSDKCIRGQQDRGAGFFDPTSNFSWLQRTRMKDRPHACDQRQNSSDGQAETVKRGQRVKDTILFRVEADMRPHLFDIGHDIVV